MKKKIIATRLATPHPPHQAHDMVNVWQWRAVGNNHGKTKTKTKTPQRSWQLEHYLMLNLFSQLNLWNTALALRMSDHWRYELHMWMSVGMKHLRYGLLAWSVFQHVQR